MLLYGLAIPDHLPRFVEIYDGRAVLSVRLNSVNPVIAPRADDEDEVMVAVRLSDCVINGDGEDRELTEDYMQQAIEALEAGYGFIPGADSMRDLDVRICSTEWAGSQACPVTHFSTSGAIREDMADEIAARMQFAYKIDDQDGIVRLKRLLDYVQAEGPRGPQPGWSDLSW